MKGVIIYVWAYVEIKIMASNTREWLPLAGENCNSLVYKMPPRSGPETWRTWLSTALGSLRCKEMEANVHKLHLLSQLPRRKPRVRGCGNVVERNSKRLEEACGHAWRQKGRWECVVSLLWCFVESDASSQINKLTLSVINRGIKLRHGNFSAWLLHL